MELLVVIAIIGILIALLLPAVQAARESARKAQCVNNLKQIGLALQNHHDTLKAFPAGVTVNTFSIPSNTPNNGFGWGSYLLPYLEQSALYELVDFKNPATNTTVGWQTTNAGYAKTPVKGYRCPSDSEPDLGYSYSFGVPVDVAVSNYAASYGPGSAVFSSGNDAGGVFYANSRTNLLSIRDGTSNTLAIGERKAVMYFWTNTNNPALKTHTLWPGTPYNTIWEVLSGTFYPINSQGTTASPSRDPFSSYHSGGANFLLCDGAVRFLSNTISSNPTGVVATQGLFQNLSHRSDGRAVGSY